MVDDGDTEKVVVEHNSRVVVKLSKCVHGCLYGSKGVEISFYKRHVIIFPSHTSPAVSPVAIIRMDEIENQWAL
jgi:hypothetical protein